MSKTSIYPALKALSQSTSHLLVALVYAASALSAFQHWPLLMQSEWWKVPTTIGSNV